MMPLIEPIAYVNLILGLCVLMWVVHEHFRDSTETADRGTRKKKEPKKKGQKPTTAELEAVVRQMFPERPEPDDRSQARAAVVKLLKASARGLFELLPEAQCATILKKIAGAGQNCPRCGGKRVKAGKDRHYREYYHRRTCPDCQEAGGPATHSELTGTIFEGNHLSAKQWLWGMYLFVGGCSTREIATELDVTLKTAQRLVRLLQLSLITVRYRFMVRGKVEFDEVYIIGGLKGQAGKIKLERAPRKRGKRQPGRGTWESDKVPIMGLVDRQGHIYGFGGNRTKLVKKCHAPTFTRRGPIMLPEGTWLFYTQRARRIRPIPPCGPVSARRPVGWSPRGTASL